MNRLILLTLLYLALGTVHAQPRLTRQQLQADADTLYSSIIRIQPDPFFRYSENQFLNEYRQARETLVDSMTVVDFYRIIIPVFYKLRDGHMQVGLGGEPIQDRI